MTAPFQTKAPKGMRMQAARSTLPRCRLQASMSRSTRAHAQAAPSAQPRIDIHGKHLKVTDSISEYVRNKVGQSAEPFQQVLRNIDVQLSARGGGEQTKGAKEQRIEITVRTRRYGVVRAEECQYDLYAAIDLASDKITRNLRKMKEKAVKKGNWPGRGSKRGEETISEYMQSDSDGDGGYESDDTRGYGYVPTDDEVQGAKAQLEFPESVKRTKVFYLEPMTLREAIDQLEGVDHDFYIYLDADSQHVQVVYRRQEGGHGVLITIPDNAELA